MKLLQHEIRSTSPPPAVQYEQLVLDASEESADSAHLFELLRHLDCPRRDIISTLANVVAYEELPELLVRPRTSYSVDVINRVRGQGLTQVAKISSDPYGDNQGQWEVRGYAEITKHKGATTRKEIRLLHDGSIYKLSADHRDKTGQLTEATSLNDYGIQNGRISRTVEIVKPLETSLVDAAKLYVKASYGIRLSRKPLSADRLFLRKYLEVGALRTFGNNDHYITEVQHEGYDTSHLDLEAPLDELGIEWDYNASKYGFLRTLEVPEVNEMNDTQLQIHGEMGRVVVPRAVVFTEAWDKLLF